MNYQAVFKRYELKYLLSENQRKKLLSIMADYMKPDKFPESDICNIYFDTSDKLLIRRSLEKPCYKEKLRVRSYGVANDNSTVFVEIKKKFDGVVYKRRIDLPENEAENYLYKNAPLKKPNQISKEIDYFRKLYQDIEPSVFISYHRNAYASKTDVNFRMTFDENILYRDYDLNLKYGIYGENIIPKNMILLEIKTGYGIPQWLLSFLSEEKIFKTSFSKYGNAYTDFILPKKLGGKKNAA